MEVVADFFITNEELKSSPPVRFFWKNNVVVTIFKDFHFMLCERHQHNIYL